MNKSLIIFDKNGRIYMIASGIEDLPEGLDCTFAELPERIASISINPDTKEVTFEEAPTEPVETSET